MSRAHQLYPGPEVGTGLPDPMLKPFSEVSHGVWLGAPGKKKGISCPFSAGVGVALVTKFLGGRNPVLLRGVLERRESWDHISIASETLWGRRRRETRGELRLHLCISPEPRIQLGVQGWAGADPQGSAPLPQAATRAKAPGQGAESLGGPKAHPPSAVEEEAVNQQAHATSQCREGLREASGAPAGPRLPVPKHLCSYRAGLALPRFTDKEPEAPRAQVLWHSVKHQDVDSHCLGSSDTAL